MAKGSSFERKMCKLLSLWWTKGQNDDVLWRSSNSGGRATVRGRQGKRTSGHCGDIAATDPIADPLLRLVTFELKRGYSKCSCADLLDQLPGRQPTGFEEFVMQAQQASQRAGTPYWALLQRRDGKKALLFMPKELYKHIRDQHHEHCPGPRAMLHVPVAKGWQNVIGVKLDEFCRWCEPEMLGYKAV